MSEQIGDILGDMRHRVHIHTVSQQVGGLEDKEVISQDPVWSCQAAIEQHQATEQSIGHRDTYLETKVWRIRYKDIINQPSMVLKYQGAWYDILSIEDRQGDGAWMYITGRQRA